MSLMNNIKVFFIGGSEFCEIGAKIIDSLEMLHELIKFRHPEEFSVYLRRNVFNAYVVGVVVCDLYISKNRSLSLYDEYLDAYNDGFLKFILIDNELNATEISNLLRSGVSTVLSKNYSHQELKKSINLGVRESISKKEYIVRNITAVARFGNLTNKEIAILSMMLKGFTNREIAKEFGNSSRTIEIHRASIFDKMNVKNAIELALLLNDN